MKKYMLVLSLMCLFVGSNVAASHQNGHVQLSGIELQSYNSDVAAAIRLQSSWRGHQVRSHQQNYRTPVVSSVQRSSYPRAVLCDKAPSNDCVKLGLVCCCLVGCAFGFGFGYEPHTYRVWNRESRDINIHYRPGCTTTDGKNTYEVDCVVYSKSEDQHVKISTSGHLTKLCAYYTNGGYNGECATRKGLKDNFKWHVHDGLTFTRGESVDSASTNSTGNVHQNFNFTADELAVIDKNIVASQNNVTSYLRGTSIK